MKTVKSSDEKVGLHFLDEPTNDLDIRTLCILEDYLDTFPGILITVSHDRYFLDRVVRRMLTFEGNGRVEQFNGGYTEYFQSHASDTSSQSEIDRTEAGEETQEKTGKIKTEKLKFTFQEKKEYDTIEQDIEKLERYVYSEKLAEKIAQQ